MMRVAPMPISVPTYVTEVLDRLTHYGYKAYVVGGCVRDSLLGRTPADWDVCTDATPEEMLSVFRKFRVFKTGLQHGTLTVRSRGHSVEVTTFRTDGSYTDNRHPDAVTFVSRVEDDLARRDFTINAMAYHPDEGLVDAFGGQQDLLSRTLRCVGEPDVRFQEDGLRIMRALRFAARFEFAIERETAYAISRNRLLLENISVERIFKELHGILCAKGAGDMLTAFPEVFRTIIPELTPLCERELRGENAWVHTVRAVCMADHDSFPIRLAMLLHSVPESAGAILRHLKSDNATLRLVTMLVKELPADMPTTRPAMRRLIGRLGADALHALFAAKQAHARAASQPENALRRAILLADELLEGPPAFTIGDLAITGNDLISLGYAPGPQLGHILSQLLSAVQDEHTENSREALMSYLQKIQN